MKTLNVLLIITGGLFVYSMPEKKAAKKQHVLNVISCKEKNPSVCDDERG